MPSNEQMPVSNHEGYSNNADVEERNPLVDEMMEAYDNREIDQSDIGGRLERILRRGDIDEEDVWALEDEIEPIAEEIEHLKDQIAAVEVAARTGVAELQVEPEEFIPEAKNQIEALEGEIVSLLDAFEAEHGA